MCRQEVIQLHKVTIPIHTNPYQNPYQSITYSSEMLCSIELPKDHERTGTNHVFYRLGKPEGEPAEAQLPKYGKHEGEPAEARLPKYGKPEGEQAEAPLPNHGKADAPLPKHA
jgi:hypothetical protein